MKKNILPLSNHTRRMRRVRIDKDAYVSTPFVPYASALESVLATARVDATLAAAVRSILQGTGPGASSTPSGGTVAAAVVTGASTVVAGFGAATAGMNLKEAMNLKADTSSTSKVHVVTVNEPLALDAWISKLKSPSEAHDIPPKIRTIWQLQDFVLTSYRIADYDNAIIKTFFANEVDPSKFIDTNTALATSSNYAVVAYLPQGTYPLGVPCRKPGTIKFHVKTSTDDRANNIGNMASTTVPGDVCISFENNYTSALFTEYMRNIFGQGVDASVYINPKNGDKVVRKYVIEPSKSFVYVLLHKNSEEVRAALTILRQAGTFETAVEAMPKPEEEQTFRTYLAKNFTIQPASAIDATGQMNMCLYNSIAIGMSFGKKEGKRVKDAVVQYYKEELRLMQATRLLMSGTPEEELQKLFANDYILPNAYQESTATPEDYINFIEASGSMGGDSEIQAYVRAVKANNATNLCIESYDQRLYDTNGVRGPLTHAYGNRAADAAFAEDAFACNDTIYLYYNGWSHYDALVKNAT